MLALGFICTCASDAAHCVCDCLLLCSQEVPGSLQGAASGVLYPLQPDEFWGKLLMELDRNCAKYERLNASKGKLILRSGRF